MKTLYKQFNADMTVADVAKRQIKFTITTDSVDRDGDTLSAKGWDLTSYQKSPVVLWAHDYSQPPVAKAISIESTANGIAAIAEFPEKGLYPFADMIHDMCKGGFLNATSVGFRGTEYTKSKDRDRGYDFSKQELLEFSIVPVPSNPEALIQRGAKNELVQRYAKAMRLWTKAQLGDDAPKLDAEQFDSLADAIAKHMKEPDEKAPEIDIPALAQAVVNIIKDTKAFELDYEKLAEHVKVKMAEISHEVIDIKPEPVEFDLAAIDFTEQKSEIHFTPEQVAEVLMNSMKEVISEVVGAQARAAINHMTGRLD